MFQNEYFKLQQEQHKLRVEQEVIRSKILQLGNQLKLDAVKEFLEKYTIFNESLAQAYIIGYVENNYTICNLVSDDIDTVIKSSEIVLKLAEIEFQNGKLNG
jgi:hypothetical protein